MPRYLGPSSRPIRPVRPKQSTSVIPRLLATTRLGRWWPLIASTLLSVCGGDQSAPAAPQSDISVVMSVASVSSPTARFVPPIGAELACDATLSAQATGTGKGTWLDAVIDFYDLRDTTRSLGSVSLQASELKGAWRQDSISAGQSAGSQWHLTGPAAFGATFRMNYQSGSATRTSSISLHCAPQSTSATAPSITSLSVTPSSGAIDPLTPINVAFTANTPAGALFSYVKATGACDEGWGWQENFTTSRAETTSLSLTWPCRLGVPIGVELTTVDVLGNSATKQMATSVTLADTVRPKVMVLFLGRAGQDYYVSPYGLHLASDTMIAQVQIQDNYRADAIFFETYPFGVSDTVVLRDSIIIGSPRQTDPNAPPGFVIPFRPEWVGNKLQYRFYGRDTQGLMSNVYTTDPGCVTIVLSMANPPAFPICTIPGDAGLSRAPTERGILHAAARTPERMVWSSTIRSRSISGSYDAHPIP
jgi:hypothetical protein